MGPLQGIRIIELAGIGPAPFCGMMLADHGAEVIRIERTSATPTALARTDKDILNRSRKVLRVNLKSSEGIDLVRKLAATADGLIEGFRPGVMERLGLGPEVLHADNPKLVYGRMTGWGQDGPYSQTAGHDINYIALSGALHAIGPAGGNPVPPLNLVGDFGGGGMMLAFGMLAAILAARESGRGQVVDCAMSEGSALLMSMMYSVKAEGYWTEQRGANVLDGAAHFYGTYETSDGHYIAIGPVEPQFYRTLLDLLGLSADPEFAVQTDPLRWPAQKERLAALFRTRTRAAWCELLEGSDACFAPVMAMSEAPGHVHNAARGVFVEVDGVVQPAPAPRYSRTLCAQPTQPDATPDSTASILAEVGHTPEQVEVLRAEGVID